jgi:ABC-type Zn uptake system ZnuABC Zn-binding protein ZnuA
MQSQLASLCTVLFAFALLACGGPEPGEDGRLRVVATTTQIGDFAANVGGDRVALTTLLKPNQDAHDFEPSPSQIRALNESALILRNGLGLDAFVEEVAATNKDAITVITADIELREGAGEDHVGREDDRAAAAEAAGHDPHVWFSVANAKEMVVAIREAFIKVDAANAETYRRNAERYLSELDALDTAIRQLAAEVPSACRKLVTNHDTLGYYADAYGFTVVGSVIPGTSTEARPSASDVADIVRTIRNEGVPAIFAEASVNPDLIRQVGREAGVEVIDDLYGDSLGVEGSDGGAYISMMQSNTRKIVEALKNC